MFTTIATARFTDWLDGLKDVRAQEQIAKRIARLQAGNFGDVKHFGKIGELRIDLGPGYRVYFARRGQQIVILLCGGDKSSQKRDIKLAEAMAAEIE